MTTLALPKRRSAARVEKRPAARTRYPGRKRTPWRAAPDLQLTASPAATLRIQPKLVVGEPNDRFEQEADRVADEVMRMPEPASRGPATDVLEPEARKFPVVGLFQRACCRSCASGGPSEEEGATTIGRACAAWDEDLQRLPEDGPNGVTWGEPRDRIPPSSSVPRIGRKLESRIRSLSGSGRPLAASERACFEPRIGADFSGVRIHTGAAAAESAREIGALAYTRGRDIVFAAGRFAPGTEEGRRLLAHELIHVVQQGASKQLEPGAVAHTIQRIPATGDEALCEETEYPPEDAWFSEPKLAHVRAGQALMTVGWVGEAVELVQQAVVAWGCDEGLGNLLPGFGVDGAFGSETRVAVRTFQDRQGLGVDGVVGPITTGDLDHLVSGAGGVSVCPSGTEVASLAPAEGTQTMQSVCLPLGIPPLTLTQLAHCSECEPGNIWPLNTTTAGVGDRCTAKRCALPANLSDCLGEGVQVVVLKRIPTVLKSGQPDVFLRVLVLDGKLKFKEVWILERYLESCVTLSQCNFILIDAPMGDIACGQGCGGGKRVWWRRVVAAGVGCPSSLAGMTLSEELTHQGTCPAKEKYAAKGAACVTDAAGNLSSATTGGGLCFDDYGACGPKEKLCDPDDPNLALCLLSGCESTLEQKLFLDNMLVKTRQIKIVIKGVLTDPWKPDFECVTSVDVGP